MDNEKLGWGDLFDFSGANPINKATKAIEALEVAYTKLASNLAAEAIRMGQSQAIVAAALDKLEVSIRAVNLATEQGRKNGARIAAEVDNQARAYNGLRQAQRGAEATNKAVADSLEGLRQQLKADRAELIALGQAANPARIQELAVSINETKMKSEQLEKAVRGVNSIFGAARGSYNALLNENRQLSLELKNLGGVMDGNTLRTEQSILREQELKEKLAANTEILKRYDAQLNQHFRNVGNYAESIIAAVRALNEEKAALTNQAAALQRAANATGLNAAAQDKLQKELSETNAKLSGVNTKLAEFGVGGGKGASVGQQLAASFETAQAELKSFALGMVGTVAIVTALAAGIGTVIHANIDYSDTLADVAKTTGLTIAQTSELAEKLKTVDTRTTEEALLQIAEIGGQLGIAKGDVEGFTKAIDVAVIALKNDFGGDVERIATELGKINTVFKVSDAVGIETALLDIGSAVNELGAAGAATAPFLTDFALRVGQAAQNAGLGLDKVLGFGAALEELGFSAEIAGTATNKLLTSLAGNAKSYFAIAKIADANLTLKQFKNLINNDVNGALNLFLAGLRKGGTATTDFATLVKSLGLKSGGAVNVLTALAKNTELIADKQRIANEQLNNGNSLATEAAIKNDNLAASYEKAKNAIVNFTTGNGLLSESLKSLFDQTKNLITGNVDWLASLQKLASFQGLEIVAKVPTKPVDDYGDAIAKAGAAMQKTATQAETLQSQFEVYSKILNPTAQQSEKLRLITFNLQKLLGDSAVVLNTQTGRYELNTAAVDKNILAKRNEAYEAAQGLAKRFVALDAEREKQQALAAALQERASIEQKLASAKIAPLGITTQTPGAAKVIDGQRDKNENPALYGKPTISKADIALYDEYVATQKRATVAANAAVDAENAQNIVYGNIQKIMPGVIDVRSLLADTTKKNTEATLKDTETDKEAAKAAKQLAKELDALARAQYELAKFRAETRATTFTRQENNEANPEEFRVAAAQKAADQRKVIAELEEREKIRIAVKEAKELKNGDAVLAVQRTLISEQYAARIAEINRDLTKEEKQIHNDLLGQLREIDRLRIETENQALEKIIEDETAGYGLRHLAQEQYAANQILLAKTIYDEEVVAANNAKDKITLALNKMTAAVAAAKAKVKPFDAKLANDDLGLDSTKALIQLEEDRKNKANGITDEKAYQKERQRLEDETARLHFNNLNAEKNGTKQALDEELAYRRKKAEETIELEKQKRDKILRIIEEGTQLIGAIGNGLFEIQSAQIDNEIAAVEKQKDNDVAIAGDNAKAKKRIEDDAARDTAKLKRKQALAARSEALFNIALNTGIAVTKAVAESPETFGLPWSAFALANGAVQAAIVLAKPIPAYAKGTASAPGGLALVGEAGAELLRYGGKEKLVTGPTLVDLQAGTQVINNRETIKIFEERGLSTSLATGYSNSERIMAEAQKTLSAGDVARIVSGKVAAKFAELTEVIANKEFVGFSFDKNGFNASVQKGQHKTEYADSRYNNRPRK